MGNKGDTRRISDQDFNTQLTWYLIEMPDTQPDPKYFFNTRTRPDPKLKNPTRLTLVTGLGVYGP